MADQRRIRLALRLQPDGMHYVFLQTDAYRAAANLLPPILESIEELRAKPGNEREVVARLERELWEAREGWETYKARKGSGEPGAESVVKGVEAYLQTAGLALTAAKVRIGVRDAISPRRPESDGLGRGYRK